MGACTGGTKSRNQDENQVRRKKRPFQNIRQFYRFGKILGAGSFGTVRLAYHLLEELNGQTSKIFAIKTINKETIGDQVIMIQRELEILTQLDHPNIIRFYETFEDDRFYHFVMEYCSGGELFDRITKKGTFNEQQTATIMHKLFSAITYIHCQGIAHRDLKPENILLVSEESLDVKIIDFGLSKKFQGNSNGKQNQVGTPLYVAPETLDGKYSFECDNWALGCIIYILLCGNTPFYTEDKKMLQALIRHSPVKFEEYQWEKISEEAKDLIRKLLIKDPKKRIKASEAIQSKWIEKFAPKSLQKMRNPINRMSTFQDGDVMIKQLLSYANATKFKREVLKILLNQMKESEIAALRNKFEYLDEDGNGVISPDELLQVMTSMGFKGNKVQVEELMKKIAGYETQKQLQIKYSDFLAATLNSQKYLNRHRMWVLYKQFDVKNKGFIEMIDLRQTLEREGKDITDKKIQEIIKEIDVNKDGKIDFGEFLHMMQEGETWAEKNDEGNEDQQRLQTSLPSKPLMKHSQTLNTNGGVIKKIQNGEKNLLQALQNKGLTAIDVQNDLKKSKTNI